MLRKYGTDLSQLLIVSHIIMNSKFEVQILLVVTERFFNKNISIFIYIYH
jgi:hypothetical protein